MKSCLRSQTPAPVRVRNAIRYSLVFFFLILKQVLDGIGQRERCRLSSSPSSTQRIASSTRFEIERLSLRV